MHFASFDLSVSKQQQYGLEVFLTFASQHPKHPARDRLVAGVPCALRSTLVMVEVK